jgi:hypothetical protein
VDLKHVLGDIQTDYGNLHVDRSLMWFVATITLRRFVAGSRRRPPHQTLTSQSLTQSLLVTCRRFAPWRCMCVLGKINRLADRQLRVRMLQGDGGPGKALDQGALDGVRRLETRRSNALAALVRPSSHFEKSCVCACVCVCVRAHRQARGSVQIALSVG